VANIKRNAKRNRFNTVCESLEGRQLLSVANLAITSPPATVLQGGTLTVAIAYDANSTNPDHTATETLKLETLSAQKTQVVSSGDRGHYTDTLSLDVGSLSLGQHTLSVEVNSPGKSAGGFSSDETVTQVVNIDVNVIATTVVKVSGTSTYGSNGSVTATLQTADGVGVNGKDIKFSLVDSNGAFVKDLGTATTGTDGVAEVNPAALAGINAGSYKNAIKAEFVKDATYDGSAATGDLNIAKANANIVVNGYTGTYDAAAHGATLGAVTGVDANGAALGTSFTTDSFTNYPGGTANWVFHGGTNYNDQIGQVAITINKANANIVVNGYSGQYDGQSHGATVGSVTGVGGVDLSSSLKLGGETYTNCPGGKATWTFDGGTNYYDQSGSVDITITQRQLSLNFITEAALNLAKQGAVSFTADAPTTGFATGESASVLDKAQMIVTVPDGLNTGVTSQFLATLHFDTLTGKLSFSLVLTAQSIDGQSTLRSDLALDTSAVNAAKAPTIDYFTIDGSTVNYVFTTDTAGTKLFSSTK
jgi:hypothetical protein